jgi:hypothetical protein
MICWLTVWTKYKIYSCKESLQKTCYMSDKGVFPFCVHDMKHKLFIYPYHEGYPNKKLNEVCPILKHQFSTIYLQACIYLWIKWAIGQGGKTVKATKCLMKNRWIIEELIINPNNMNIVNGQAERRKSMLPTITTNFI